MRAAAQAVAHTLPNAKLCSLPGQDHSIGPDATARVLAEFLRA
jgi:hypothetical protein